MVAASLRSTVLVALVLGAEGIAHRHHSTQQQSRAGEDAEAFPAIFHLDQLKWPFGHGGEQVADLAKSGDSEAAKSAELGQAKASEGHHADHKKKDEPATGPSPPLSRSSHDRKVHSSLGSKSHHSRDGSTHSSLAGKHANERHFDGNKADEPVEAQQAKSGHEASEEPESHAHQAHHQAKSGHGVNLVEAALEESKAPQESTEPAHLSRLGQLRESLGRVAHLWGHHEATSAETADSEGGKAASAKTVDIEGDKAASNDTAQKSERHSGGRHKKSHDGDLKHPRAASQRAESSTDQTARSHTGSSTAEQLAHELLVDTSDLMLNSRSSSKHGSSKHDASKHDSHNSKHGQ